MTPPRREGRFEFFLAGFRARLQSRRGPTKGPSSRTTNPNACRVLYLTVNPKCMPNTSDEIMPVGTHTKAAGGRAPQAVCPGDGWRPPMQAAYVCPPSPTGGKGLHGLGAWHPVQWNWSATNMALTAVLVPILDAAARLSMHGWGCSWPSVPAKGAIPRASGWLASASGIPTPM